MIGRVVHGDGNVDAVDEDGDGDGNITNASRAMMCWRLVVGGWWLVVHEEQMNCTCEWWLLVYCGWVGHAMLCPLSMCVYVYVCYLRHIVLCLGHAAV
jgi:hypothetical protein